MEKNTTRIVLQKLHEYINENGRFPQQTGKAYEKSLAQSIANFKSKGKFSQKELDMIYKLRSDYASGTVKLSTKEKIEKLEQFCNCFHRWPSRNAESTNERYLYKHCKEEIFVSNPELLGRFIELKKKHYQETDSELTIAKLKNFIKKYHFYPRENSVREKERLLYQDVDNLIKKRNLTDGQRRQIMLLRKNYDSNSIWKWSIFYSLVYQFGEIYINTSVVVPGNKTIECITCMPCQHKSIAIFFDSARQHSHIKSVNRDEIESEQLANYGFKVYRFRENGCLEIVEGPTMTVINVTAVTLEDFLSKEFLPEINRMYQCKFFSKRVPMPIKKIVTKAVYRSAPNYRQRKSLLSNLSKSLIYHSFEKQHDYMGVDGKEKELDNKAISLCSLDDLSIDKSRD